MKSTNKKTKVVRRRISALADWRLKRVAAFVEKHLAKPLTLAEIASAAGLTRMHFAAQFRVATGLRPREYVMRRRIERAQCLLAGGALSIVEVALSVGFQNQAHFSTVFRRYVGQTPARWRRLRILVPARASSSCVLERQRALAQ
jgi:AraC family transcriptional regulator